MTEVPDYVPMLIKGLSENPQSGGCVVQIANWLYDPTLWTDEPHCVDYVLANAAIIVNDLVDDDHRRQLALLAPRLSGTHVPLAHVAIGASLDAWTKTHPEPYKMAPPVREVKRTENGEEWVIIPVPGYVLTVDQQDAVDWLNSLVDEYDRLTGRTSEPLPIEKWDELRELMGQK